MPQISQKGIEMPLSPIRKLVPYAETAKAKGHTVYHLNIGQPDIPTPKVAMDAVKNCTEKVIEYSHSAGNETYRKKLAKFYQDLDINVDYTNILITTGGSEAITLAFLATLNPGDEVIIPEPFYANYVSFAKIAGVKVIPVTSSIDTDFALPPIEEIEKIITPRTKGIVIVNPNNPTGYLYSKDELMKLQEMVLKHDMYLYADEVYREFVYDGIEHHSVMSEKGLEEHAIMVDSVSKRYSMCGARIGCIVSRNSEVISTTLKYAQARLSSPTYALLASEAALDTPKSYFLDVIKEYDQRRKILISELEKIQDVKVSTPKGAFYCIAQLPVKDADDFAQWMLEKFNDQGETVMVAPASGFYSTPGSGKNQIRIAYVLKKESLIRSVALLRLALDQYPG